MKTLFIDTHSNNAYFAIKTNDFLYEEIGSGTSISETAMVHLQKLLTKAKIKTQDLNEIIVVNGPGSFTGVRIGVTIAKVMAYSLNIPIKTATSLETIGVSSEEDFDIVTVKDPKGYYISLKVNNTYTDFNYLKTTEFEEYIKQNNYKVCKSNMIDINKILKYLEDKEYINPHQVNPIYIKKIDALK